MFTLETSSQKRFLHNQIRNALLLREKRSKNAFKTTWTQLEKYKQEHPEQSPSINEIQTLLLQAYKRYFPFRARHASETVQRPDQMPEIATGSTSSSESRKKNGTTWHESLEKVLNVSSRKLFTKEPLTPFLLQPAAAKQIFGGKNDSLPEKLQYVMRKTRNLFHTLLRNNSGKSLDVQIHRITPGNLRTINAGSRFSAGDVTLEAKKEVKIHLNRKWRIRFEDRTITISGHLIRRPKKASSPMKRKWKLLYLHLK